METHIATLPTQHSFPPLTLQTGLTHPYGTSHHKFFKPNWSSLQPITLSFHHHSKPNSLFSFCCLQQFVICYFTLSLLCLICLGKRKKGQIATTTKWKLDWKKINEPYGNYLSCRTFLKYMWAVATPWGVLLVK